MTHMPMYTIQSCNISITTDRTIMGVSHCETYRTRFQGSTNEDPIDVVPHHIICALLFDSSQPTRKFTVWCCRCPTVAELVLGNGNGARKYSHSAAAFQTLLVGVFAVPISAVQYCATLDSFEDFRHFSFLSVFGIFSRYFAAKFTTSDNKYGSAL